MTVLSYAKPGP